MSAPLGFYRTLLDTARDNVALTLDNLATLTAKSALAHANKDSVWGVLAGAMIGFLPCLIGVAVGPLIVKVVPARYVSEDKRELVSGVVLACLSGLRLWSYAKRKGDAPVPAPPPGSPLPASSGSS